MTDIILLMAGSAAVAAALVFTAFGSPNTTQITPQTVSSTRTGGSAQAIHYRSWKVVGSTVVNEAGVTLGTIDDLIVMRGDRVPFAVLTIGGLLGVGSKFVVVPAEALQVHDNQMVLAKASKESLMSLAAFTYAK